MNDAATLLESLTRRGLKLTPRPPKLIVEPSDLLTDADRDAIRKLKPDLLRILAPAPERLIEATFTSAPAPNPGAAEFPPCPVCGQVRYWLAPGGRVLCGSRTCASALRFQLLTLDFRTVS